jgi:amino-acid N-acetyltransferase
MAFASLRPAVPADLARIERLLVASGLESAGVDAALATFFVAESGGEVVGVMGFEASGDVALLRSAAVDTAWRGGGLGRSLVECVNDAAAARGVETLYLLTTTAERWFESQEFVAVSRDAVPQAIRATTGFTSTCPASATVMMRRTVRAAVTGRAVVRGSA